MINTGLCDPKFPNKTKFIRYLIRVIFNRFVSRALKLCFEKYLHKELNFLVDMFVENGHDQYYLNFTNKESKHHTFKAENTGSNYSAQNKKRTPKNRIASRLYIN